MTNPFEILEARLINIEKLLIELKYSTHEQNAQGAADELLTIQQAASLLKLSVPTIYGYVSRAEIPVSKKGKRLYFSKQELVEWIKEGRKKTKAEIEGEAINWTKRKKP